MSKSHRTHRFGFLVFIELIATAMVFAGAAIAQDSLWTNQYTGRIDAETTMTVRVNEDIDAENSTDRVFLGYVAKDVKDAEGIITVPEGSAVELVVRRAANDELLLDLRAVTVYGRRYSVQTDGGEAREKERTGGTFRYAAGSAPAAAVIGGVPGAGRDARIRTGMGAGARMWTAGQTVHIPVDSLVVVRLKEPLREPRIDRYYKRDGAR